MSRFSFWSFAAILFVLAACGDSSGGGPPSTKVKDMSGRTCSVIDAAEVTCDKVPTPAAPCATGKTACYSVGTTGGSVLGPGAICAGCCEGNTGTFLPADCSDIVCSTSSDCPDVYPTCTKGQCMSQ